MPAMLPPITIACWLLLKWVIFCSLFWGLKLAQCHKLFELFVSGTAVSLCKNTNKLSIVANRRSSPVNTFCAEARQGAPGLSCHSRTKKEWYCCVIFSGSNLLISHFLARSYRECHNNVPKTSPLIRAGTWLLLATKFLVVTISESFSNWLRMVEKSRTVLLLELLQKKQTVPLHCLPLVLPGKQRDCCLGRCQSSNKQHHHPPTVDSV